MGKLSHPTMKQERSAVSSISQKPKTYVVEDLTNGDEQQVEQLEENIIADVPIEYHIPVKKTSAILEELVTIGRATKELEIDGVKFEISTLTNKEYSDAAKVMYSLAEASDLFRIKLITLGHALRKINGLSLNDFDIEGEFESLYHKRMSIIDYLQVSVVDKLFAAYEILVNEKNKVEADQEEIKK